MTMRDTMLELLNIHGNGKDLARNSDKGIELI